MKLPTFRRRADRTRGQAMVEFALILPILILLLLLAIDFGRVFFGWVAINNAARIAANEAAFHPEAWEGSGNAALQVIYRDVVAQDLRSVNCQPAGGSTWQAANVPDPTYINMPSTPTSNEYELGDHVRVSLTCRFSFLTPFLGFFMGNPMPISADAEFAVKGGEILGIPVGGGPPSGCLDKTVPNMVGTSVAAARSTWTTAGFTGTFTPATGQDGETVDAQNTSPASVPGDCLVATATVTVTTSGPPPCSNPNSTVPNVIGRTVLQARGDWTAAGFTGSFSPASGSDANIVSAQSTSPNSTPGDCIARTATLTVTHAAPPPPPPGQCTAPETVGKKISAAELLWNTAGFTPANLQPVRPPNNDYTIATQDKVGGQNYPCDVTVMIVDN